jgi:Na+-transporting NADH:ubiquinone oxidoreductase subunit C
MTRWPAFLAAPVAVFSPAALATVYLSVEQAQQAIFPGGRFVAAPLSLTDEQKRAIAKRAGANAVSSPQVWKEARGGWFIVDHVIGKHELITYAVGLDAAGSVRGIEVLEYLENYGGQIRYASWRKQFLGKKAADPVRLDEDILNISGATLSCRHVTEGVRRLLALHEVVLSPR